MKIEKLGADFRPVQITLETPEDLAAFRTIITRSDRSLFPTVAEDAMRAALREIGK